MALGTFLKSSSLESYIKNDAKVYILALNKGSILLQYMHCAPEHMHSLGHSDPNIDKPTLASECIHLKF